jgi:hypothetical protein
LDRVLCFFLALPWTTMLLPTAYQAARITEVNHHAQIICYVVSLIFLPRLASNHSPPDLWLPIAGTPGMAHCTRQVLYFSWEQYVQFTCWITVWRLDTGGLCL